MAPDPWYISKRFWASIFMVISTAIVSFGYDFDIAMQEQMTEVITTIGGSIAIILTTFSKLKEGKKDK